MARVEVFDEAKLEVAWGAFLANDVTVKGFAAGVKESKALAVAPLSRTVHLAYSGATEEARAAADLLAETVIPWGSVTLLQGLVGTAFAAQERWDEALAAHAAALPLTPRWHATSVQRVLGVLADDLLHLGRDEEAARFAERGLAWDPTNPELLVTLGVALARTGASERASAIATYLESSGYPESLRQPLVAAPGVRPASDAPYVPDLGRIERLTEEQWFRFASANRHNLFVPEEERQRAHAFACLQRGRLDYAVFGLRVAARYLDEKPRAAAETSRAWSKAAEESIGHLEGGAEARARVTSGAAGPFAEHPHERVEFVEARAEAGDASELPAMLFDLDAHVVLHAARALAKLGVRDHLPFLQALAAGERAFARTSEHPSITKLLAALNRGAKKTEVVKAKVAKVKVKAQAKMKAAKTIYDEFDAAEEVLDALEETFEEDE